MPQLLRRKDALTNFASKSTGKNLCFDKKKLQTQVSFCEYCKNLKKTSL